MIRSQQEKSIGGLAELTINEYLKGQGRDFFVSSDPPQLARIVLENFRSPGGQSLSNMDRSQFILALLRVMRKDRRYSLSGAEQDQFRKAFLITIPDGLIDKGYILSEAKEVEGELLPTPEEMGLSSESVPFQGSPIMQEEEGPQPRDIVIESNSAPAPVVIKKGKKVIKRSAAPTPQNQGPAPGSLEDRARKVLQDPSTYMTVVFDVNRLVGGLKNPVEIDAVGEILTRKDGQKTLVLNVLQKWESLGFSPDAWTPQLIKSSFSVDINKARERKVEYGSTERSMLRGKKIESPYTKAVEGMQSGLREWYTYAAPPTSIANLMQQYEEDGVMRGMNAIQKWEDLKGYDQSDTMQAREYIEELLNSRASHMVSYDKPSKTKGGEDSTFQLYEAGDEDTSDQGFLQRLVDEENEKSLQQAGGRRTANDIKSLSDRLLEKGDSTYKQLAGTYWMDFWEGLPMEASKAIVANPMAVPLEAWITLAASIPGAQAVLKKKDDPEEKAIADSISNLTQYAKVRGEEGGPGEDPRAYKMLLDAIQTTMRKEKNKGDKFAKVSGYSPVPADLLKEMQGLPRVDTKPQGDADRIFSRLSDQIGNIPRRFLGTEQNVLARIGGGSKSPQEALNRIEWELQERRKKNPGPRRVDMDLEVAADYLRGAMGRLKNPKKRKKLSPATRKALRRKSRASGVDYDILREVYTRGVAAYYATGSRAQKGPQQWAYARVNSFIKGGKTRYTADRDLAEKAGLVSKRKENPALISVYGESESGDDGIHLQVREDDMLTAMVKAQSGLASASADYVEQFGKPKEEDQTTISIHGDSDEGDRLNLEAWGQDILRAMNQAQGALADASEQYMEYMLSAQDEASTELVERAEALRKEMEESARYMSRWINPSLPPMDTTWVDLSEDVMVTDFCDGTFTDGMRALQNNEDEVLSFDFYLASLGGNTELSDEDIELFCALFDMDPEDL